MDPINPESLKMPIFTLRKDNEMFIALESLKRCMGQAFMLSQEQKIPDDLVPAFIMKNVTNMIRTVEEGAVKQCGECPDSLTCTNDSHCGGPN